MTEIKDPFPPKDTIEEELAAIAAKIPALPTDFSELRQVLALLPSPIPSETPSAGMGDPGLFSVGAAAPNQSSSSLIGGAPGTTPGTTLNTGLSGTVSIYGDGSDGVGVIAVNSSLARDMYFTDLTINAGIRLNTNGWKIYCSGVLTNLGTISNNGGDCTNSDGSNSYSGLGGTQNSIGGGQNGYSNAYGQPAQLTATLGGRGGSSGGFWYAGGGYFYGGAPTQVPVAPTGSQGATYRDWDRPWRGILLDGSLLKGGSGGAGGGQSGYGGLVQGGGGGGGGVVSIIAKIIVNAGGVIEANGGKGGNCYSYPSGISAGAGGGGGGGVILVTTTLAVSTGTIQALGGSKGLGANPGTNGMPGLPGTVIQIIQS